jgi:hypothetical protein
LSLGNQSDSFQASRQTFGIRNRIDSYFDLLIMVSFASNWCHDDACLPAIIMMLPILLQPGFFASLGT